MIVRPRRDDHRVIGKYTGKIIVGVGMLMVVPLLVTLVLFAEWDTAFDFVISMMVCFIFGFGAAAPGLRTEKDFAWSHGAGGRIGSVDHRHGDRVPAALALRPLR